MDNLPKPAIKKKPEELGTPLTREQLLILGVSESAINGLPEPKFKKVRLEQEEPKESGVTVNDLPELPFEKILGYLSLQERIKCRAVSRRWCETIDSFRPKSLCYSKQPSGYIYGKSRWISGEFARNFINSARFDSFFRTFGPSILSNLKHLRLCNLRLDVEHATEFTQTLKSFGLLEKLDIIQFEYLGSNLEFKLNLPMLNSIQIKEVKGIKSLTLDAPKLQNVMFRRCTYSLDLEIVHVESVEKLIISGIDYIQVKNLKNLKYLYGGFLDENDSTFISGLEQLKEIHLFYSSMALKLFEQKQRYGRVDLKIFLCGCLLSGPNDPAINLFLRGFNEKTMAYLAEHPDRLADQIPFCTSLHYSAIEQVPRGLETSILNRFTDLREITVFSPVQDIERFLDILKSLDNIAHLHFFKRDQAQDLFNRLPDCCAVQKLMISSKLANFGFLCRLSHLIKLQLFGCNINAELIREVFKELKFLLKFHFYCVNKEFTVKVEHRPKRFIASVLNKRIETSDLDSVISFVVKSANE